MSQSSVALRERYDYSKTRRSVIRAIVTDDDEICTRQVLPPRWDCRIDPWDAFDSLYLRKKMRPKSNGEGQKIRSVDLYSGCGGLSLGAWEACRALGMVFHSVKAVDNDHRVLKVYESNFKKAKVQNGDIEKLVDGRIGSDRTKNERKILRGVGNLGLLLSGPPCQGHSNLNNHTRREDDRNSLYSRVVRFAELSEPEHVLIENVPQVLLDRGRIIEDSFEQLRELGYLVSHDVVDLSTIGVPQRRKRHVLVASRTKSLVVRDVVKRFRVANGRELDWCIRDLERVEEGVALDTPSLLSKENVRRISYLFNKNKYNLPNNLRPLCHRKKHNYLSMYGRLRWNEPAPTITTGFLSPGQGRYIHPSRRRTITPHEAARIQFFPDFFDFGHAPTRESLKKMIGNAAPMKLAYVFVLELLA